MSPTVACVSPRDSCHWATFVAAGGDIVMPVAVFSRVNLRQYLPSCEVVARPFGNENKHRFVDFSISGLFFRNLCRNVASECDSR